MDPRVRRAGTLAWGMLGIVTLLAVVGVVAWWVRVIWPPLIFAAAIVFLLNPVVSALQRRSIPRVIGTALSYLGFFSLVALFVIGVAPLAVDQADELSDDWPELRADVEERIDDLAERSEEGGWIVTFPTVAAIEEQFGNGDEEQDLGEQIETVREVGTRIFHVALILFLGPIIAFYLLVDLPHLRRIAESLVPAKARDEVLIVGRRLSHAVGGFFRGQLFVAVIVGVMVSVGLAIIDLPFWLLVGAVAGLFNLVPLIGPWVGAVPGIVIALTTRDTGTAFWVAGIMAGAQQIDNHFISPLVMQRAVKLHPAAVMMALLAGGTIGGFLGLLVAVPTTAVLKIVLGHLWRTYVLGEPIEQQAAEWRADDAEPGNVVEDIGVAEETMGFTEEPEAGDANGTVRREGQPAEQQVPTASKTAAP
ncbi:AI-2E family transporter [soil metagenome]